MKSFVIGFGVFAFFIIVFMIKSSNKEEEVRASQKPNPEAEQEARDLVYSAYQLTPHNNLDSARSFIKRNNNSYGSTSAFIEFHQKMKDMNSPDFLHDVLIEITDEEVALLKKKKFTKSYFGYRKLDSLFYIDILDNLDVRKDFIKADKEKRRNLNIAAQFSAWDGSHNNLEKIIKANMNDPDSYEHVETGYEIKNDYLKVKTIYRGKNAYGALVLGSATVKADIQTGEILEVVETQ